MPNKLIKQMHTRFGINYEGTPRRLSEKEKEFRITCLKEEIQEYIDAVTIDEEYDALIDLIVFAMGSLERHGFPFDLGFEEVMKANMRKEIAKTQDKSRRGFALDLIKPLEWEPPNMLKILEDQEEYVNGF